MTETGLTPAKVFYCVNALHIPKFDRRNRNIIVKSGYVIDRRGWRIAYLRLMAGNISSAFCFFFAISILLQVQGFWLVRT